MPIIIDTSIQGKLQHPILPNVLTEDDRVDLARGSNGMINVADKNAAKINQSKGIPAIPAQVKNMSDGAKQGQSVAKSHSVSISESVKGQNINATA